MASACSKPTRERLIRLVRMLDTYEKNGKETVSSQELQNRTGWTSDTIRRDISVLPESCSSPQGYNVSRLKIIISNFLNLSNDEKRCCIIGMGRLGAALADYKGFAGSAFRIVAGFDSSVNRVDTLVTDFPLYTVSKLETIIKQERIEYAILAVPEDAAQGVANRLAQCGIKGIVNYTAALLRVAEPTRVYDLSVMQALLQLSSY